MKAIYIETTGTPDNIRYGDLPVPQPTGSQVLVAVKAVSLNPVDTYIRAGLYPMDLPKPFILGCDLSGIVEAVGPDVQRFKAGDRVWGSNQGLLGRQGTFAEYAAVEEKWLYPVPDEVSFEAAAAVALVGITAHLGLFCHAQLKMGETVFVHGGVGGVGSCVIQMARAIGARVFATVGSQDKIQICRRLGANTVVNYKAGSIDEALDRFGPINVWWENIREPNFDQALAHLSPRGRIILMAGRDAKPPFPVGAFYGKDARLLGFTIFNSPAEEQRKAAAEINRWLARGKLCARIDRVMKLSDAAEAHRLQEANTIQKKGTLAGKIVLVP